MTNTLPGKRFDLILIDLDGTLVAPLTHTVSKRAHKALLAARDIGCEIVVCTGRTRYTAQKILNQIPETQVLIAQDGGYIWNMETGDLISHNPISTEDYKRIIEIAIGNGLHPLVIGVGVNDGPVYISSSAILYPIAQEAFGLRLNLVDDFPQDIPGCPTTIEVHGTPSEIDNYINDLHTEFDGSVFAARWEFKGLGLDGVLVHNKKVNKGAAGAEVAKILSIPRERVIAIGNDVNDVEMLEWAGLGVCVGDGHPKALAAANEITSGVLEDGAAEAIEKFVLNY